MEPDNAVTVGEVYRLLKDMDDWQGKELAEIKAQVRLTNGRTNSLEMRVNALEFRRNETPPLPPEILELMVMARDAKGVARVTRWIWAFVAAVAPFAAWWFTTGQYK